MAAVLAAASLGSPSAVGKERSIVFYNIHTKETVKAVYKRDGKYVATAMTRLNWVLRDWRRNETTRMDPALIDLVWEMHQELGSRQSIHVVSGYRSPATNAMLRRTVGGQASRSRHMDGQAVDIHFPDVPLERMRYSALVRERGGVGYYPTSSLPFVHVDTGTVRHWPRLPRTELALLFPSGSSRHVPADGRSIRPADVTTARTTNRELARRIAAARLPVPDSGIRMAAAEVHRIPALVADPIPKLSIEPRLAIRPPRLAARSSRPAVPSMTIDAVERERLALLAEVSAWRTAVTAHRRDPIEPAFLERRWSALAVPPPKQFLEATRPLIDAEKLNALLERVATAPAWDEEHPDELDYRPFPIAPFLTASGSADDPALKGEMAMEPRRTLELLQPISAGLPMRIRSEAEVALPATVERRFQGSAVAPVDEVAGWLSGRRVKTAPH